jgi:hypothetical protein
MAIISVAPGWDGTALMALSPNPHFSGIRYGRVAYTPRGVSRDAAYALLEWRGMSPTAGSALFVPFGFGTAGIGSVTISLPTDVARLTLGTFNAIATFPEYGDDMRFINPIYESTSVWLRLIQQL